MSQKEDIVNLLNLNKIMTQGVLAEAIYGDKSHSPNIYAALKALVDKGVVIRAGSNPSYYSLSGEEIKLPEKTTKSNKKEMRDVSGDVISDETLEEIEALVQGTDNYGPENELITRCLKKFPSNTDPDVVAMKVGLIDITNSTHLSQHKSKISMVELANIIADIPDVDNRIKNGDPEVVNIIARSNGRINLFSFASKYCCYHNSNLYGRDDFSILEAMEKRNEDLSEHILVAKLQEILRSNYSGTIDLKNVDYQRIFGQKEKNYGDYDIVFYVADKKELFLIESKYFSDSLNSSGLVNDYNKMFGKGGYYTHCRERYDLIMKEPEKIKSFINETDDISVHMLFISSKPIEMEFQDADGIVTFLSLGIFEKYLKGNLISEDGMSVVRPVHVI